MTFLKKCRAVEIRADAFRAVDPDSFKILVSATLLELKTSHVGNVYMRLWHYHKGIFTIFITPKGLKRNYRKKDYTFLAQSKVLLNQQINKVGIN
jgi:hypothetical protein